MPLAKIHPGLVIKASDLNTTLQPIEVEINASFQLDSERIYIVPNYNGKIKDTLFDAVEFKQQSVMVQNTAFEKSTKCMSLVKPKQLNFTYNESVDITFNTGFIAAVNNPALKRQVNPVIAEKYCQHKCDDVIVDNKIAGCLDPDITPIRAKLSSGSRIIVGNVKHRILEDLKILATCHFFVDEETIIGPRDLPPELSEIKINILRYCHFLKNTIRTNLTPELELTDGMDIRLDSNGAGFTFKNYTPWELNYDNDCDDLRRRPNYSVRGEWTVEYTRLRDVSHFSWINKEQVV